MLYESVAIDRKKIYKYKCSKVLRKDDDLSFRYDGFQMPRFVFTKLKTKTKTSC